MQQHFWSLQKSSVVLNVAKDIGLLWMFVAELFIAFLDTFEEKMVPSEDLRNMLFAPLTFSVLFFTFSLALAPAGAA